MCTKKTNASRCCLFGCSEMSLLVVISIYFLFFLFCMTRHKQSAVSLNGIWTLSINNTGVFHCTQSVYRTSVHAHTSNTIYTERRTSIRKWSHTVLLLLHELMSCCFFSLLLLLDTPHAIMCVCEMCTDFKGARTIDFALVAASIVYVLS